MSHYLKRQRTAKEGSVVFKLDISKAYDKLDWDFAEGMLWHLGFYEEWISLMMLYVKTVHFNVLVNDDIVGPIIPQRGLQQGDPLSPYLLILCAEGFTSLINKFVADGRSHDCKISRGAPIVSHLFFADDTYRFFKVTERECVMVRDLLQVYRAASGQGVNLSKSSVSFNLCVTSETNVFYVVFWELPRFLMRGAIWVCLVILVGRKNLSLLILKIELGRRFRG